MGLTGLSPQRRTPGTYREFVFAAGPGSSGATRDVLIYGNKTSAGSATAGTLIGPIVDQQDCIDKVGRRSELYHMWRLFNAADKTANVYLNVVAEGSGSLTRDITFAAGAATDTTTCKVELQGESVEFLVSTGDTAIIQAAACASAINAASDGTWMATAAVGGGGSEHIVTVTASQLGSRLAPLLNISLRVTYAKSVGTTATLGSAASAGTDDDFTAAYALAAQGEYWYQISPKTGTSAPTATDNGIGEGIAYIKDQNLPINGKLQTMYFGLTGTQAQATTVAIDSDANNVLAGFFHAEDNDWMASMIAAHMVGIVRSQQMAHPSANLTGYRSTSANVMLGPPDPFDKTDRPTAVEIEADLSNGVTPIAFSSRGDPYIVRQITSYSESSSGVKDYRASEGHTPSAIDFAWQEVRARWEAQKQPFIAEDPPAGAKPLPGTSTPSQLSAIINSVIDDLCGPRPLGLYDGPILSPSTDDVQEMRDSIVVLKVAGGLNAWCDFKAVEHNNKLETKIRQINAAY